jgi:hypothetical protein
MKTDRYPSGLVLSYAYTSIGCPGAQVYWTAHARDAELRLIQHTAGNGVVTTQSFDAQSGRLTRDPRRRRQYRGELLLYV